MELAACADQSAAAVDLAFAPVLAVAGRGRFVLLVRRDAVGTASAHLCAVLCVGLVVGRTVRW